MADFKKSFLGEGGSSDEGFESNKYKKENARKLNRVKCIYDSLSEDEGENPIMWTII
jgi:hypothetical protein